MCKMCEDSANIANIFLRFGNKKKVYFINYQGYLIAKLFDIKTWYCLCARLDDVWQLQQYEFCKFCIIRIIFSHFNKLVNIFFLPCTPLVNLKLVIKLNTSAKDIRRWVFITKTAGRSNKYPNIWCDKIIFCVCLHHTKCNINNIFIFSENSSFFRFYLLWLFSNSKCYTSVLSSWQILNLQDLIENTI